ncbi:MAG: response regulator transcription factor [Bacteroidetes bacterium]|nr:response regulator transcription factor [Bacteroidota bacterium]MCB0841941.1 response regulator transcription factor [Bacteroidota bacterium]
MDKIKVLYVEDEPFLAKIVKESLESRDFSVKLIEDGAEVIAGFQQFSPQICILDVMLPNQDGFSLAEEIRQIDPAIPIIFLTAKVQTEDLLKGFHSGGNDYIKKPFSMEELIARINNLLKLVQTSTSLEKDPGQAILLGKFSFLPLKYELRFEEEVRKLSHRETQLLQILADHKNTAVERKEILQKVWGDDSFFNSRNLDVYITRLRDFLKKDDSVKIITLKGIGYHFVIEE